MGSPRAHINDSPPHSHFVERLLPNGSDTLLNWTVRQGVHIANAITVRRGAVRLLAWERKR
jgi:hypothetical protein